MLNQSGGKWFRNTTGPRCATLIYARRNSRTLAVMRVMSRSVPAHHINRCSAIHNSRRQVSRRALFQCLSDGEMPKRALGASVGLHGILLMLLILVPVLLPQTLRLNYRILMVAPPPEPPRDVQPPEVKLPPIRAPRPTPIEPEPIVEKLSAPAPIVPPEPEPRILKPVPKPTAPPVAASVAPSLAT